MVLAVASAVATAGIVWLVIKAGRGLDQWWLAALKSPLAVKCLVLMAGGLLVLGVLVGLAIRLRPAAAGRPWGIHVDQGGTAAIEMAFVFPLALMIFLVITQAALLFNANMVTRYASFAAARMAVVVVPMDIGSEGARLVWPGTEESQGPSDKLEYIRQAAVLALIPISAELKEEVGDTRGQAVHDQTTHLFSYLNGKDQWWFHRIQAQYAYANAFTKIELREPDHWQDGNPDNDCPSAASKRDTWTQWGWTYVPFCPYYHQTPPIWDFWWYEDLDVRVVYQYLLEVPYASRFMGLPIDVPGRSGTSYAAKITWVGTLSCEGGPELKLKG
jgi:hypothetical protein